LTFGRADLWIAAAFAAVTALTRAPFVTAYLWEWDSVLYARALERGFHVSDVLAVSRPHPPGYVFYVASASLARALDGFDANGALVAVSVVASAAAAAATYLLCARLAGRAVALLVTLGLVTSPLFWLQSAVASPYALLVVLSTTLALVFVTARGRGTSAIVVASVVFGLAAGFRQDLLLFLGPLWLWAVAPAPWRSRALAAAGLAVGCLAWFVPSALASGGAAAYIESTRRQFTSLSGSTTMNEGSTMMNLVVVGQSVGWAMVVFGLVLLALAIARVLALVRGTRAYPIPRWHAVALALWTLPPLLFYVFVHVGQWGQLLSLVPSLFALTAVLLRGPFEAATRAGRSAIAAALVAASLVSAALYVGGKDPVFSADSLEGHDRATGLRTAYIRGTYPTDGTLIVAGAELLVAGYYLPGYQTEFSDDRAGGSHEVRLARDTTVVFYEDRALPRSPDLIGAERPGNGLTVVRLPAGTVLALNGREVDPGPR